MLRLSWDHQPYLQLLDNRIYSLVYLYFLIKKGRSKSAEGSRFNQSLKSHILDKAIEFSVIQIFTVLWFD